MALREVVALNESVPQLQVPQAGDSYLLPRSTQLGAAADLVFAEKADHSETPAAGYGYLWVKNEAPSALVFTNDAGSDLKLTEVLMTVLIEAPANGDYVITYDAPFAGVITSVRAKTEAGTCTVTGKIEGVALGGTANSATTTASTQTHSSANAYAVGDTIKVTLSDVNAAANLSLLLSGVRT